MRPHALQQEQRGGRRQAGRAQRGRRNLGRDRALGARPGEKGASTRGARRSVREGRPGNVRRPGDSGRGRVFAELRGSEDQADQDASPVPDRTGGLSIAGHEAVRVPCMLDLREAVSNSAASTGRTRLAPGLPSTLWTTVIEDGSVRREELGPLICPTTRLPATIAHLPGGVVSSCRVHGLSCALRPTDPGWRWG